MEFKHRKEVTLHIPNMHYGYFKLRDFKIVYDIPYSSEDAINYFIKSKYFLWQNGRDADAGWNFHGIYDAAKIVVSDFESVDFNRLKKELLDFVGEKCGDGIVYESKIGNVNVSQLIKDSYAYFLGLKQNPQGKPVDYSADIKWLISSVEKTLDEYNNAGNFFKLNLSQKEKRHKNTVYAYFFSAVIINTATNTFVTIEFGLD